jgi:hypothetical protein
MRIHNTAITVVHSSVFDPDPEARIITLMRFFHKHCLTTTYRTFNILRYETYNYLKLNFLFFFKGRKKKDKGTEKNLSQLKTSYNIFYPTNGH